MSIDLARTVDRNPVGDFHFLGAAGQRPLAHAHAILKLLGRLVPDGEGALFATPHFNETRSEVLWQTGRGGEIAPFWELPDAAQARALDRLESAVAAIRAGIARVDGAERPRIAGMLGLLLTLPAPVEYRLFRVGGDICVTNWGMTAENVREGGDTLSPFIAAWRERLAERERRARAAAEAKAREASILGRLLRLGGRRGAITVTLLWNNRNDLDLHVLCPDGQRIHYMNKEAAGGMLDIDRNAHPSALTDEPIENIFWERRPGLRGTYRVLVHHFRQHDPAVADTAFTLRIENGGTTRNHEGVARPHEMVEVASFSV